MYANDLIVSGDARVLGDLYANGELKKNGAEVITENDAISLDYINAMFNELPFSEPM